MAKDKVYHPDFIEYMKFISEHPNYRGLPMGKGRNGRLGWVAAEKSIIGSQRVEWVKQKAKELNIPDGPGLYAKVMLEIHPTKQKVCQICGRSMSLYYHYPNENLIKAIKKQFGLEYSTIDHISDIWDDLEEEGFTREEISKFFIKKGNLNLDWKTASKMEIIEELEYECRCNNKKILGPGAMSNFPDRFDGFHSYNRCCRSKEDTGRWKENLDSYGKDRRAYEYWSDGNIRAADKFMHSSFFKGTSADHLGPISLGFVHDSHYLRPLCGKDNSAKRNKLYLEDVEKIIEIESSTHIPAMTWYSEDIWNFIKENYVNFPKKIGYEYRNALLRNRANFMLCLKTILVKCNNKGQDFLVRSFIEPKMEDFDYDYEFDQLGNITNQTKRNKTERSSGEEDRIIRIAMQAIDDYDKKSNRKQKGDLTLEEKNELLRICFLINKGCFSQAEVDFKRLFKIIQTRIIKTL